MNVAINKSNYYCLVAGFPNLLLDEKKPQITSLELKNELEEQLHPSDYNLIKLLYLTFDNKNLLNLLLKENSNFNPLGNYSLEFLEAQIEEPEDIVPYIKTFIYIFNEKAFDKSKLNSENVLQSLYYEYVLEANNNFLKQWFIFDRDLKNILTSINSRKFGFDIKQHLLPTEIKNEVYEILSKKTQNIDALADEVPFFEKILNISKSQKNLSEKEKAYDLLKWEFLEEYTFFNYFSIEKIASFIIKLNIVERWTSLNHKTGKIIFEDLINDINVNYKFNDEFIIKSKTLIHKNL